MCTKISELSFNLQELHFSFFSMFLLDLGSKIFYCFESQDCLRPYSSLSQSSERRHCRFQLSEWQILQCEQKLHAWPSEHTWTLWVLSGGSSDLSSICIPTCFSCCLSSLSEREPFSLQGQALCQSGGDNVIDDLLTFPSSSLSSSLVCLIMKGPCCRPIRAQIMNTDTGSSSSSHK